MRKFSSKPEMGDALYSAISSATSDSGRLRINTTEDPKDEVSSAWNEHMRHMKRDPANDAHVFPVAAQQSKAASEEPSLYQRITDFSPVPVEHNELAKYTGGAAFGQLPGNEDKRVYVDPNNLSSSLLAHEVGHAQLEEDPVGKFLQSNQARRMAGAGILLAPFGAFAPRNYRIPLTLGAASLAVPLAAGEAAATYKGHKALEDVGATSDELAQYRSDMIAPQSSYVVIPALSAGLGLTAGALRSKVGAAKKLHDRTKFRNLNISIENRAGSFRHWYDPHNKRKGKTLQRYPYGYIRMTEGMDGDHVDCYIGPKEKAKNVYVITTNKGPDFKQPDEQKCMLGFESAPEAKNAFLIHFDDSRFFRSMKAIPYEDFETKVLHTLHGRQKKIASNLSPEDYEDLISQEPGPFRDSVPGDYIGLPHSSLVGMRKIEGDAMTPRDKIDKTFRHMDQPMGTRVLEGNSSALPASPGV